MNRGKNRKVKRAQSLSPVNRRKTRSKAHQPRERIIKARSQSHLTEIVPSNSRPKTIIVRENETKKVNQMKSSDKKDKNTGKREKGPLKKADDKNTANKKEGLEDKKTKTLEKKKNTKKPSSLSKVNKPAEDETDGKEASKESLSKKKGMH